MSCMCARMCACVCVVISIREEGNMWNSNLMVTTCVLLSFLHQFSFILMSSGHRTNRIYAKGAFFGVVLCIRSLTRSRNACCLWLFFRSVFFHFIWVFSSVFPYQLELTVVISLTCLFFPCLFGLRRLLMPRCEYLVQSDSEFCWMFSFQ